MKPNQKKSHVIVVDLDGTLTFTDTFFESLICLIKKNIFYLLILPFWLLQGKSKLKSKVSDRIFLDATLLPYNKKLIEFLLKEKKKNKKIILCSATDKRIANSVAEHLNLFDEVIASDKLLNVAGINKKKLLEKKFGKKNFDYAGNSKIDIKVWEAAKSSIVVNANKSVIHQAKKITNFCKVFPKQKLKILDWLKIFRIHHWIKNLIIFIPLIAAHQINNFQILPALTIIFFSFSICASGIYIINDLIDLQSDRKHLSKRNRPIASGILSIQNAILLSIICITLSIVLGLVVSTKYIIYLVFYLLLNILYSLYLKRFILIDCFVLVIFYNLRIIVGGLIGNIEISFWLFMFSTFIFLSLALIKRYIELQKYKNTTNKYLYGRGYKSSHARIVKILGLVTGYLSVFILFLYANASTTSILYNEPKIIWFVVPVFFYWMYRMWLKAEKNEIDDDPIIFIIKDKISIFLSLLILIIFVIAAKGV